MRLLLLRLSLALSLGGIVAGSLAGGFVGGDALWPFAWLAWAPAGYMILQKQPRNAVGRTLMFIGVTMGTSLLLLAIAAGSFSQRVRIWSELGSTVLGVLPWLGIIWLVLVYPGHGLAGRFERATARLLVGYGSVAMASFALTTTPMATTGSESPLAVPQLARFTSAVVDERGFMGLLVLFAVSLILLVRRWRRSTGIERPQFRWLFLGAALMLTVGLFIDENSAAILVSIPAGFAIPVTIGIAITRYRLFEIDRIISRTVSYALVVGLLGATFFGLVAGLTTVLPSDEPLVVAGATLLVAAMFNPIRRRVQAVVDRRFNRSRHDKERVIERFIVSLNDRLDVNEVADGWVDVVAEIMQPSTANMWLRR